jgi:hypothetical protein
MAGEPTMEELAENVNNLKFGDDRLGVQFYMRTVEDKERTLSEGRKCFKDVEFVRIMIPGDRNPAADRRVQRTDNDVTDDRLRFPKQYARFKNQQEQPIHDGTPLNLWPGISGSLVEELKFINIHTVEQLADLADTYVGKMPNGQSLKAKAATFVQALKDQSAVNKLQMALEERDNRIQVMEQNLAALMEQVNELSSKKGK